MATSVARTFKKTVKFLLRFPADALIGSSKTLPEKINERISFAISKPLMEDPHICAKFYPYEENDTSYFIRKPSSKYVTYCEPHLPFPPDELWRGSRSWLETQEEYLSWGRTNVKQMREITTRAGFSFEAGNRILDFGCATGVMIRWLNDISEKCEIWGVDIVAEYITWCQQYLSPPFHFVNTTTFPHLPFEDRYFDFIYAGSVFTHIADLADAWLLELKRILRPSGKLYLTVHDNYTLDVLLKSENGPDGWFNKLMLSRNKSDFLDTDFGVFTIDRSPNGAQVFYDRDYLCRNWGRFLKILSVSPGAYGHQTAILLEK